MTPTYVSEYHKTKPLTTPVVSTSPKSGPPIPNSNPLAYYTLEQAQIGGIRSGATRRFRARNRHAQVRAMDRKGKTQAVIASLLGYSQPTVSRILSGAIRTCLNLRESVKHTAQKAALAVRQRKAVAKLAALEVLKAAKAGMREQTHAVRKRTAVPGQNRFGKVDTARKRALRFFHWRKAQEKRDLELAKANPTLGSVGVCPWCGWPKYAGAQICPYCGVWVFCLPEKAARPELKGDANSGGWTR